MLDSTLRERVVTYQWDSGPGAAGEAAGSPARAGLASFLRFVLRAGVARALAERVRRPVPERCTGFPQLQKSLALLAALAAGCRSAGYQATAVFAGDTGGGGAEVLAIFLDPGNAQATWRFADALAALERVLGPLERLPGLVLRFDCQYATPDDLALLLRRRSHFVGRVYADATAAGWAQEHRETLAWHELSPIKGGADLGAGPVAPRRPAVVCRRLLVRSTGARHRYGYTAIVTDLPAADRAPAELEPFYEARQTIEGWLSEATAALQLKGLWSRGFAGLEAFLLHAALVANLLNWWERRELLPASGRPLLGLRQLSGRVITMPARLVQTATDRLVLLLPPPHAYARCLVPTAPGWQLPLPFDHLVLGDAHF